MQKRGAVHKSTEQALLYELFPYTAAASMHMNSDIASAAEVESGRWTRGFHTTIRGDLGSKRYGGGGTHDKARRGSGPFRVTRRAYALYRMRSGDFCRATQEPEQYLHCDSGLQPDWK